MQSRRSDIFFRSARRLGEWGSRSRRRSRLSIVQSQSDPDFFPSSAPSASLAEEELKLDEEWAEESRRKAREESINRQMNVQETERLRKLHEEKL